MHDYWTDHWTRQNIGRNWDMHLVCGPTYYTSQVCNGQFASWESYVTEFRPIKNPKDIFLERWWRGWKGHFLLQIWCVQCWARSKEMTIDLENTKSFYCKALNIWGLKLLEKKVCNSYFYYHMLTILTFFSWRTKRTHIIKWLLMWEKSGNLTLSR